MDNKSLIILHKHNGENQCWSEIPEGKLQEWMIDGSIEEGDVIIYPQKSLSVIVKKSLILNNVSKQEGVKDEN